MRKPILYGIFGKPLTNMIKKAMKNRLVIETDAIGRVYVCNGFCLARMYKITYEVLIKPVTKKEAPTPGTALKWVDGNLSIREEPEYVNRYDQTVSKATDDAQRTTALFDYGRGGLQRAYTSPGRVTFIDEFYDSMINHETYRLSYHAVPGKFGAILIDADDNMQTLYVCPLQAEYLLPVIDSLGAHVRAIREEGNADEEANTQSAAERETKQAADQ